MLTNYFYAMNNFCRLLLMMLITLCVSCYKHPPEPKYKVIFVYKNKVSNEVSIDFYRKNAEKVSVDIIDSVSIPGNQNQFNYTFAPDYNDSITIKFHDEKKIVFKYEPNSSNWNINAINSKPYNFTENISGNQITQFYTYTINDEIYKLAK